MQIVLHHFENIASTNDWAKAHFMSFGKDTLTLVTAESQMQGRGQFGRRWVSPAGLNLYVSFCFYLEKSLDLFVLTHILGISVSRLMKELGILVKMKWPNDILVEGKKIAGILCESIPFEKNIGIILGLGINVNMPKQLLDQIDQPATSIFFERGKEEKIEDVLLRLQSIFHQNLLLFLKEGFQPFQSEFEQLMLSGFKNHL